MIPDEVASLPQQHLAGLLPERPTVAKEQDTEIKHHRFPVGRYSNNSLVGGGGEWKENEMTKWDVA